VKPLKLLVAAYACRPGQGSEPGVGWNLVRELAKYHQVWVLTRENNRSPIEAELALNPIANLQVVYSSLPGVLSGWQKLGWAVQLHYSLWQLQAYREARQLHREIGFDLSHHVTYGRYCAPSFLAFLPIPFVWGPVGGGESAPYPFWQDFDWRGKLYELMRDLSRWTGELNPLVQITARRSAIAFACTSETAVRLSKIGAPRIEMLSGQTGINFQDLEQLKALAPTAVSATPQPVRFLSLGRLLHWKGFHLGLRAFAEANLPEAEYWVVGEGAELPRLEALADQLGIGDRVRFFGSLPRDKALSLLRDCDVLVHPSLHDFSPTVCLEAMAVGKPVLCLNLGGPSVQVTDQTGCRIDTNHPEQVVHDMAKAMMHLAADPCFRQRLGQAGKQRISEFYNWEAKGQVFIQLYQTAIHQPAMHQPETDPRSLQEID
jgi:glycosyltransferase involved in cell wall biosynthesis